MSFISLKHKRKQNNKKLPPHSAWGNYRARQKTRVDEELKARRSSHKRGEVLINASEVSLSYEGREVISRLSFDICEGDYLCIIGENGSGKSTLLSAVLGLKKVSGGKISLKGISRGEIGVLPQRSETQNDFPITVREVVMTGCIGRSFKGFFTSKKARDAAFENMEKLGITAIREHSYSSLSGGQRQRTMLARALCAADKMLILDEPVTGLDSKTTADMYSLIHSMNLHKGMTVVMVTHDISAALKYATHILRINKDSAFFGSAEEYRKLPEADKYCDPECFEKEKIIPYGDGGFRYTGDEK